MNIIVDPNGNELVMDKEEGLKRMLPCPSCDENFLSSNEALTVSYRRRRDAEFLNDLRVSDNKEVYMFKCTMCGYELESEKIDIECFKIIKKSESLYEVALNCNPYTGQTWSAKSGFPTEVCPINGNQCYSELWKVCPHIGNAEIREYMKAAVPVIGELE